MVKNKKMRMQILVTSTTTMFDLHMLKDKSRLKNLIRQRVHWTFWWHMFTMVPRMKSKPFWMAKESHKRVGSFFKEHRTQKWMRKIRKMKWNNSKISKKDLIKLRRLSTITSKYHRITRTTLKHGQIISKICGTKVETSSPRLISQVLCSSSIF